MLSIDFIRNNQELVEASTKHKQIQVDFDRLFALDDERRELIAQVDALREQRNHISAQMKGGKPDQSLIDQGKQIKVGLSDREELLKKTADEFRSILKTVPNVALDHVPVGETDEDNVVAEFVGEKREFGFAPRPHWDILNERDMMDKERAAKISGSRFVYLKGGIVQLQFAIVQYVMSVLTDQATLQQIIDDNGLKVSAKPFSPILPPAMLRTEPYEASARLNAEEVTYKIEQDDLWLNASAEHTLCTMYWNEILPADELPLRYIGYLTSFRREAGTYGKDTEGIIRLHQFDKLEMESFTTAADGLEEHKLMIAIQRYLMDSLGLPYNFLQKCTADIGKPNASGTDIDCWYPGQERFIETHTADFMTDYQSRDLNIRTKVNGQTQLVHTNDATAFALSRILAAITENYQLEDGMIEVPEVLQPFIGGREQI